MFHLNPLPILCLAGDSLEILDFIFSEKQWKNKYPRLSSTAIVIGAVRFDTEEARRPEIIYYYSYFDRDWRDTSESH